MRFTSISDLTLRNSVTGNIRHNDMQLDFLFLFYVKWMSLGALFTIVDENDFFSILGFAKKIR